MEAIKSTLESNIIDGLQLKILMKGLQGEIKENHKRLTSISLPKKGGTYKSRKINKNRKNSSKKNK